MALSRLAAQWGTSSAPISLGRRLVLNPAALQQVLSSALSTAQAQATAGQEPSTAASTSTAHQAADGSPQARSGAAGSSSPAGDGREGPSSGAAGGSEHAGDAGPGSASSASEANGSSRVFGSLHDGWETLRARMMGGGGARDQPSEDFGARAARLMRSVAHEVQEAVLPRDERMSLTARYDGPVYDPSTAGPPGTTALAALPQQKTRMSQLMEDLQAKFGHHPLFQRLASFQGPDLRGSSVARKAGELADDLRERYETSDHPMVHKVEDVKERLFGMNDAAAAMHEIRARDPAFDMSRLLAGVKGDAPVVVKAFLTHDLATLERHCGPELLERFAGIFRHFHEQGLADDPTILFVGEVELVELRLVDGEPLVVVQFNCQQIKCTRDKFGNVVDGSPNSIQKVFYFWGLQQESHGIVLPDGTVLPPRWVIKDMMWQSMLALV